MEKIDKLFTYTDTIFSEINKFQENPDLMAERAVHVETVLRVLKNTKEKIHISMMLPQLLDNPYILSKYIEDPQKCEQAVELINDCLRKLRTRMKETFNKDSEVYINHSTVRLIDFFHENYKFIKIAEKWEEELTEDDHRLLQAMDTLCFISEEHLKRSAVEELKREKEIHQLHHENEILALDIEDMEKKAEQQKIHRRWNKSVRQTIIQKYDDDLAYKKWDNSVRVRKEILDSTRRIRAAHVATIQRQRELEEELEKTKSTYENTLKKNLELEKETRAEKNKLLLQLESLLKKYDTVMGDKMKESMRLSEEYEEEKKLFDEFMVEFSREEEQYNLIVRERENEEKRIFEQNLALFIMNRAAKIIQRAWRQYWREKKKLMKKSKKGGKKGKKK